MEYISENIYCIVNHLGHETWSTDRYMHAKNNKFASVGLIHEKKFHMGGWEEKLSPA